MRRILFSFFLGIGIGLGVGAWVIHRGDQIMPPLVIEPASENLAHKSEYQKIGGPKRARLLNVYNKSLNEAAIAPPRTEWKFNIEENDLRDMEEEGSELTHYAYSEETTEGWKIHILPEDRVFLKSGIRDGDLITKEGISSQLALPERRELTQRFVAILKQIEK